MRRKIVSNFLFMLLVFSLIACGSKVVSEEQIKSYVILVEEYTEVYQMKLL